MTDKTTIESFKQYLESEAQNVAWEVCDSGYREAVVVISGQVGRPVRITVRVELMPPTTVGETP